MDVPKRCTRPQLAKVGIALVCKTPLVLQCHQCGAEWRPQPLRLVRTPYWRCLNGCNHHDV
jgi:hypothetical protein